MSAPMEAEILTRVIEPEVPGMTPDAARSVLALGFAPSDLDRINALAEKARQGILSSDEQSELDSYERVGHLLALLQAKARSSLRGGGGSTE